MKKRAVRRLSGRVSDKGGNPTSTAEVGQLSDTITQWTAATRSNVIKYWKGLAAVAVVAVLIFVGFQIYKATTEQAKEDVSETLFRLTHTSMAADDALPDTEGIRTLVDATKGTEAEKLVLKRVVGFLVDEGAAFAEKAREREAEEKEKAKEEARKKAKEEAEAKKKADDNDKAKEDGKNEDKADIPPALLDPPKDVEEPEKKGPDPAKASADLLALAKSLVDESKARFADDTTEMAKWAGNIEKRIQAELDRSWLPPERSYSLQPPAATSTEADPSKADASGGDSEKKTEETPEPLEKEASPAEKPEQPEPKKETESKEKPEKPESEETTDPQTPSTTTLLPPGDGDEEKQ